MRNMLFMQLTYIPNLNKSKILQNEMFNRYQVCDDLSFVLLDLARLPVNHARQLTLGVLLKTKYYFNRF